MLNMLRSRNKQNRQYARYRCQVSIKHYQNPVTILESLSKQSRDAVLLSYKVIIERHQTSDTGVVLLENHPKLNCEAAKIKTEASGFLLFSERRRKKLLHFITCVLV